MAQTTILAAGTDAATSSNIEVAAGAQKTVGIFSATSIPPSIELFVRMVTPGSDNQVARLSNASQTTMLVGPGTYKVVRKDISDAGVAVGAYVDA